MLKLSIGSNMPTPAFQEVAFVIGAEHLNPKLLTPEFLHYSNIVPEEWEIARPPLLNDRISQIIFTNDISLVAEPNTISFTESLKTEEKRELRIQSIVRNYIQVLSNVQYRTVSINCRCYITFPEDPAEDVARNYITKTFLAPGAWKQIGTEPVRPVISLYCTLNGHQFSLAIVEAVLQSPDIPPQSSVLFSSGFPYELVGDTPDRKIQHLYHILDRWSETWTLFRQIIDEKFLGLDNL